jgi:HK97 gp10 family phage protein
MADGVTISLDGFGELEKALKTIGPLAARRAGTKAMKAAAKPIVGMAKTLAPVLTGELEESITSAPQRSDVERELKIQIGFRKPAASRAHFTEFGTAHSAPQPFMRPGY